MLTAPKHQVTARKPSAAIILARLSDARETVASLDDQIADGRKLAARLGWGVGPDASHVVVENIDPDTGKLLAKMSAYKRRKVQLPDGRVELRTWRPGFRRALDMLASGAADGLIALDLDRTARDMRDLEDLIDVVESRHPRVPVESVTGSLRLASDADVTMARVMCAVGNKSSRDTGRRVARAYERRAAEGGFGGGSRPYGHEAVDLPPGPDGKPRFTVTGAVRPEEAAVLMRAAEALLSGVGLTGIVRDLNARGVPAPRANRWTHRSLRRMLLQPRTAGLMAYRGELLDPQPERSFWQPILDYDTWLAVRAILTSPARPSAPGPKPRHLLTGVARCGHPSHPDDDRPPMIARMGGSKTPIPVYRCQLSAHLSIARAPVDKYVSQTVIGLLARPDAADLLAVRPKVNTAGLAQEANSLRARLANLGDVLESGDMSPGEYRTRKARLSDRLASVEAELSAAAGTSPLAGIAGRPDADRVWHGLEVTHQKAIIDRLLTVVILPASSRGPGFDPDRVRLTSR